MLFASERTKPDIFFLLNALSHINKNQFVPFRNNLKGKIFKIV